MEMDSSSARFHEILVHFWHAFFTSDQEAVHPLSREIILASKPKEFQDLATLARFNEAAFEASIAQGRVSIAISGAFIWGWRVCMWLLFLTNYSLSISSFCF